MISKRIARQQRADVAAWPIIRNVQFNYYRGGIGTVEAEMH